MNSMIMLIHNNLYYTDIALKTLFDSMEEPYELIIIDNGSLPSVSVYLEGISSLLRRKLIKAPNLIELKILRSDENLGFPKGMNLGMKEAKGDFIFLLNNDLYFTEGWDKEVLWAFGQDESLGIVTPMTTVAGNPLQWMMKEETPETYPISRLLELAEEKKEDKVVYSDKGLIFFCVAIKREVIDKIGYLDENFGLGCYEDSDYCKRARNAGYKLGVSRRSFVCHFGSKTYLTTIGNEEFEKLKELNRVKYEEKWKLEPECDKAD